MAISFSLLVEKNKYHRLDVYPFLIGYIILFYYYATSEGDDEVYLKLAFIGFVFLNCICYLLGFWSVRMRSIIQYSSGEKLKTQKSLKQATHILVQYSPKLRSTIYDIVPLKTQMYVSSKEPYYLFHFFEKKYVFNEEIKEFKRIKPVIDHKKQQKQFNIKKRKEFTDSLETLDTSLFDKNEISIPAKKFKDILRDQIMEPFSFFQIFSVSLWLMDENFVYPLLTLFLLFMSACTVVIQRLKTLLMLRQMRLNPQYIQCYRNSKWERINSDDLLPGDIVIIQPASSIKPVEGLTKETDEQFLRREIPFSHKLPDRFFKTEAMNINSHKTLPCDLLLISGNCVVNESILTGESIPQIKDSIEKVHEDEKIDIKSKHKNSVLFCGTEVIQVFGSKYLPLIVKNVQSNNACIARVLRTGYDTSKGKLMRTVLFNNENLQIKQTDAFALILVLLLFSIISSGYVLINGLEDGSRDKNKLFLRCILIVTTVVPPELPMILSIAVNTSLLFLQKKKIFCTEPYRIPFGGKINTLAFDKTGTLTSDDLLFIGVVDECEQKQLKQKDQCSKDAQSVLAGCQSLITQDKKLIGDPIELLYFENSKWQYSSSNKWVRNMSQNSSIWIVNMFPFKSELKRMSTVVQYDDGGDIKETRGLCKGAPEVIKSLLLKVPQNYDETYKKFTKKGYRVLALSYKKMEVGIDYDSVQREDLEKDLIFAGFFICESPLKRDTKRQIQMLQDAKFNIIMITGDNLLTAVSVGNALNLGASNQKNLALQHTNGKYQWLNENEEVVLSKESVAKEAKQYCKQYMLCVEGDTLKQILNEFKDKNLCQILESIVIYARTSPVQKELIVTNLKYGGACILMCGDGTNDVGALKKSDLGIALVGTKEETEQQIKERKDKKKKDLAALSPDPRIRMQQLREQQQNMLILEGELNFKFGDACIAAPFTSKHSASIRCVQIILRQGICTLVTTIQTYKILALSSIIQAYSLSALHLQSLKFSETQYTILGISAAYSYFQFQNTKPLKRISSQKPIGTIFEIYWIISVVGQAILHLHATEQAVQIGKKYSSAEDLAIKHDSEFKPTFLNTAVFLQNLLSQTCIFLFNNGGQPHVEGLQKNTNYLRFMIGTVCFCFVFALNLLNDWSVSFDMKFDGVSDLGNYELTLCFFYVLVINYTLEMGLRYIKFRKWYGWI